MMEFRDVEHVIGTQRICVDHAVRLNFLPDYAHQQCRSGAWDHHRVDAPAAFQQSKHRDLSGGATAAFPLAMTAKIALIDFNLPCERKAAVHLLSNDLPQP